MNPNSEQKRIAFGYNRGAKNEIVLHPGQAATVQLIFDYYLEDCSIAKIKDNLESMGIPSPLNGKKWSKQTLANILASVMKTLNNIVCLVLLSGFFLHINKIRPFTFTLCVL